MLKHIVHPYGKDEKKGSCVSGICDFWKVIFFFFFNTLLLFEPETFQNTCKVVPIAGTLRVEVPVLLSIVLYSVGERISDGG